MTLPKRDTALHPAERARDAKSAAPGTNLFCPVCGHQFRPEEIGKKLYCRRCGYLES